MGASSDLSELVERAVAASRLVSSPDEYETVWEPLRAAAACAGAVEVGLVMLGSEDPLVRSTGCDLLGAVFNGSDAPHRPVADALVELVGREADTDVLCSAVHALEFLMDLVAVPVLVGLAVHPDSEVRLQVALALQSSMIDLAEEAGVDELIRPLVAALLEAGDAFVWVFDAAGWLCDESLVPLLEAYEGDHVQQAIVECDPVRREARDHPCDQVLRYVQAELDERGLDLAMGLSCEIWDYTGPLLSFDHDPAPLWFVPGVIEAVDGDLRAAARRIVDQALEQIAPSG